MKKIGLITVLILCVVVGGVYAAWDYAQGDVQSQISGVAVQLTVAKVSEGKGTISAQPTTPFNLFIDDTDGNRKADTMTGEGSIAVEFAPGAGADADVISKGIVLEYVLSTSYALSEYNYKGVQVFSSIVTTPQVLNNGQPTLNINITSEDIAKLITVNSALELKTKADYDDFSQTLPSHGFKITIREKVVTQ